MRRICRIETSFMIARFRMISVKVIVMMKLYVPALYLPIQTRSIYHMRSSSAYFCNISTLEGNGHVYIYIYIDKKFIEYKHYWCKPCEIWTFKTSFVFTIGSIIYCLKLQLVQPRFV